MAKFETFNIEGYRSIRLSYSMKYTPSATFSKIISLSLYNIKIV